MHYSLAVHVNQRAADLARDVENLSIWQRPFFAHQGPQRNPLDVFHRDVHSAFSLRRKDTDDVRMIEPAADVFFALETAVEYHVTFKLEVRDFDRDGGVS